LDTKVQIHEVCGVGIEGSTDFGRPVSMHLLARGVQIVEVPPLMTGLPADPRVLIDYREDPDRKLTPSGLVCWLLLVVGGGWWWAGPVGSGAVGVAVEAADLFPVPAVAALELRQPEVACIDEDSNLDALPFHTAGGLWIAGYRLERQAQRGRH